MHRIPSAFSTSSIRCMFIFCALLIFQVGCQQAASEKPAESLGSKSIESKSATGNALPGDALPGNAATAKLDPILKVMIDAVNRERDAMIKKAGGVLSDYKAYQDGEKNGMVTEYVLAAGADMDPADMDAKTLKENMLNTFRADPKSKILFAKGVTMKIIYRDFDGSMISEAIVGYDDLYSE